MVILAWAVLYQPEDLEVSRGLARAVLIAAGVDRETLDEDGGEAP